MHTPHIARRTRLWLIARASGLPPGGISGLGMDSAGSGKSIESLFRLFRGTFEAVLPFFWQLGGPQDFPVQASKALPPGPLNLP